MSQHTGGVIPPKSKNFLSSVFSGRQKGKSVVDAKDSSRLLYLSLPYTHKQETFLDIFLSPKDAACTHIAISCFDISNPKDSIRLLSFKLKAKAYNKKQPIRIVRLPEQQEGFYFHPIFRKIVTKNKIMPAGNYCYKLVFNNGDSSYTRFYSSAIDSSLPSGSSIKSKLDGAASTLKERSILGISMGSRNPNAGKGKQSVMRIFDRNAEKTIRQQGLSVINRKTGNKQIADIFCDGRFVGSYEIDTNKIVNSALQNVQMPGVSTLPGGINTNLDGGKPIFAQLKSLKKQEGKREGKGSLTVSGNLASGQEENSQNENNYYEVAGQLELPVMNIPVMIESYYTSQDKNRLVKSSYFRVHYDTEQAKSELMKLISGYNNQYAQTLNRDQSFKGIYGTYLNSMNKEKDQLSASLLKESGVADIGKFKADTTGLYNELLKNSGVTDATGTAEARQSAKEKYNKVAAQYARIQELDTKIKQYSSLLERYHNNVQLDSLVGYDKLKGVGDGASEDMSYRQLLKAAKGILPAGETNRFITGLSNLDLGIFSKKVSNYTINGQTIKGLDVSYDLGVVETSFTLGRIEYVSRNGTLDRYNGYSGRVGFKPFKKQQTSLIYFGYSPSRKMLQDDGFFKDVDMHMPAFRNPIHIVSVKHEGTFAKDLRVEGEVAASFHATKDFKKEEPKLNDRLSYNINMTGTIPRTTVELRGGYEHAGKHFENNTLPLNLSGTDRYTAGATGQFLKNVLSLGLEYNYILQQNFAGRSAHSKWGFEVKTNMRRYPSVSLSYKPFSTFRNVSDTFAVPQRPIVGEVWLGKVSYQLRNKVSTTRFTLLYNRNTAIADTMHSSSEIAQFNVLYAKVKWNLMLNTGFTNMHVETLLPVHTKTTFVTIAASYKFEKSWQLSAGQDVGFAKYGFSRYAANIGIGYKFKKVPLSVRSGFRYNRYKMTAGANWKEVYSGLLDVNWQFRFKMKDK